MKSLRLSAILGIIIIMLLACEPKTTCELSVTEKTSIEDEIEIIVRNFMNAETLCFETHTALRANQPGYIFGGDGKLNFRSYSEYQAGVKKAFSTTQKFTEMSISELYVYALSNNAATCTAEFMSKILTTSGDTLIHDGCWTMVFKKFDNEWKIIQENGTHLNQR